MAGHEYPSANGSAASAPPANLAPPPRSNPPVAAAPARPPAPQPPNADPSIARGLSKIAQLRSQCGSQRAAVGDENAARVSEIDAAKAVEEADWLNLESVSRQAAGKVAGNSVYARQAAYRACLYAAEGRIKKAQPTGVQYTPAEARGAGIVSVLDGLCTGQKQGAEQAAGSVAVLTANNRVLYNAVSGNFEQVSAFNAPLARQAQEQPAAANIYGYWGCIAGGRLSEIDTSQVAPAYQPLNDQMAQAFQRQKQGRTEKLHNHANDATSCLSVVATGTKVEWGTSGKFKLVNTCGYPVSASWCANTRYCETGLGNLWTIGAGKDYPIFFADPANPDIRVGACRVGAQATNKVDVVANNNGVSMVDTAHYPPQPAPGVSIMQGHKCD